jgi:UDP-GlcNAc:undecaprenyl-phosphate GlcNAc-1-phosphate transferase
MSAYTFQIVFLGAMFMAIVATWAVVQLAGAMRIVDLPGVRKVHALAMPRIGGAAIAFAMLAATLPALWWSDQASPHFHQSQKEIMTILAGGAFMFFIGLVDDIRGLSARVKLFGQLAAALAVCLTGLRIEQVTIGLHPPLDLSWISWPLTMLWIVGVTNALNLIDGLDGLAAGISAITCTTLIVFAWYMHQPVTMVIMLAMLGSLMGFLFLNFNPARVFMGDSGSLFIGFILSAVSIRCANSGMVSTDAQGALIRSPTVVGLLLPALAMGVPILDTLFSILRRTLQRRGIFSPDRGHIHHRLLAIGLRQHQVALIVYVVTLCAAGIGLFMVFMHTHGRMVVAIFLAVMAALVLVFRAAGAVRLKETVVAWRRNSNIARDIRKSRRDFDHVELLLCEALTFDQWWTSLCQAAQQLEFVRISLSLTNRDGTTRTLLWQRPGENVSVHEKITVAVPVRHRRPGDPLKAEVDVYLHGSIESAGRRMALFGRLIDEHSIASLPPPPAQPKGSGNPPAAKEDSATVGSSKS